MAIIRIIQNDRPTKMAVLLYIDKKKCTIKEPTFLNGNCLTCEVTIKLAFAAVYRSPSYNNRAEFDNFLKSVDNILSSLKTIYQKSIYLFA